MARLVGTLLALVVACTVASAGASQLTAANVARPVSVDRLPESLRTRLAIVRARAGADSHAPATVARQLLEAVVAGLPAGQVAAAVLAPSPHASSGHIPGVVGHTWLYLKVRAPANNVANEYIATWQGEIVAGAFRQASQDLGLDGLRGVSITAVYPDGRSGSPFSHVIARPLGLRAQSEAAIASVVRRNLSRNHRFVDAHLRFINVYSAVPIVTLRFANPTAYSRVSDAATAIFGDSSQYEGLLLEVVQPSGRVVRLVAIANRTGSGQQLDPS
jgi:hypothetical protein